MNTCFREPLIYATKGGVGGGGARLTSMGSEVLALYRAMEDDAATAVPAISSEIKALSTRRKNSIPKVCVNRKCRSNPIGAPIRFAAFQNTVPVILSVSFDIHSGYLPYSSDRAAIVAQMVFGS